MLKSFTGAFTGDVKVQIGVFTGDNGNFSVSSDYIEYGSSEQSVDRTLPWLLLLQGDD